MMIGRGPGFGFGPAAIIPTFTIKPLANHRRPEWKIVTPEQGCDP